MRVLITRPEEDSARIAQLLEEMGHEPILLPLLTLRFLDGPDVALDGVQAVLATSANGVRALARRSPRRDVPVFAVGPQTAKAARDEGFATVQNAKGDAHALARETLGWAQPGGGALLHVRGADGGSVLAEALAADGFKVLQSVLYDVAPPEAPPAEFASALARAEAVMVFSPRSARVLRDCAQGLDATHAVAVCISQAAASSLKPMRFAALRIAPKPNQNAMLACLG